VLRVFLCVNDGSLGSAASRDLTALTVFAVGRRRHATEDY